MTENLSGDRERHETTVTAAHKAVPDAALRADAAGKAAKDAAILLLTRDAQRAERWMRLLTVPGMRVWHDACALPANTVLDVIVTDRKLSEDLLPDQPRLREQFATGLIGVVGIDVENAADVHLPGDVTERELQIACSLLTETTCTGASGEMRSTFPHTYSSSIRSPTTSRRHCSNLEMSMFMAFLSFESRTAFNLAILPASQPLFNLFNSAFRILSPLTCAAGAILIAFFL
jgi:hypothetical protein